MILPEFVPASCGSTLHNQHHSSQGAVPLTELIVIGVPFHSAAAATALLLGVDAAAN